MADINFNANEIPEDDRSFEPLPGGEYKMQVIDSEIRDTKSGTGQQLVLTLEVIEGPHSNRRVWDRLNIVNQNPDAQRIAERALADLCLAVGLSRITNSEELHFKPFVARVGIKVDKTGQYGPQNTVRYKSKGATSPAPRPGPQASSKPAGTKPWQRPTA